MAAELSFNTIDRMAAFLQNADDAQMSAQEKLALAVSGWLLGSDSAIDQLPVALSMYGIRRQVREYLNEPVKLKREQILDGLRSQEGSSPALIVGSFIAHETARRSAPTGLAREAGLFQIGSAGLAQGTVDYLLGATSAGIRSL